MLITISSVRGAPGVTSWTLLLAAAWPSRSATGARPDRIVVEADCSGGVLGARYGLGVEPGTPSLVAACRRVDDAIEPRLHGRHAGDGLWLVPGPEVAEQATAIWRGGVGDAGSRLSGDDRIWLADLGRAGPDAASRALVASAAINIVVTSTLVEDVVQIPARVAAFADHGPTCVIAVGRGKIPPRDLHRFLGSRLMWAVPTIDDLPALAMRAVRGGRHRRTAVWRAAVAVAADVAALGRSTGQPSWQPTTPTPGPSPSSPPAPPQRPLSTRTLADVAAARGQAEIPTAGTR